MPKIEKIKIDEPCSTCGGPKFLVYEWKHGDVSDCYYECKNCG